MKIGVIIRNRDPLSLLVYRKSLETELQAMGVRTVPCSEADAPPQDCDIIWDPGLGMRKVPRTLRKTSLPIVATVHGLRSFSLPARVLTDGPGGYLMEQKVRFEVLLGWRWLRRKISAVIAVSHYGAEEAARALNLRRSQVFPIYHGVDHAIFNSDTPKPYTHDAYLLIVAQYAPKKNVDRVFQAYERLSRQMTVPRMIAIVPGYKKTESPDGVTLVASKTGREDLARWYAGAMAFVFPSLHETFGMPIVEAMACGCPVITSGTTACAEVAADAALFVDPFSIDDISSAMRRIITDTPLRKMLSQKGVERSRMFTWRKSAEQHLAVFERFLSR